MTVAVEWVACPICRGEGWLEDDVTDVVVMRSCFGGCVDGQVPRRLP